MSIVDRARDLAYRAHAGQVDKAGRPYIEHVARVAERVRSGEDEYVEAIAWLHDVVEDSPKFSNEVWAFPARISIAVDDLTRMKNESLRDYYNAVKGNGDALRVKLADIADNSDESRLALLDEKTAARLRRKYAKAIKALTGGGDG